jgi:HSP20 family protein
MTRTDIERFFDPWREFERMSRLLSRATSNANNEFPAVNVWVNGEHAVITTELPGISRDAIDISVSGNTITLNGSRPSDNREGGESYHRHELWHGDFNKTIKLPFTIDAEKVTASYKKGILHIELPQAEADKPRKIDVKSA